MTQPNYNKIHPKPTLKQLANRMPLFLIWPFGSVLHAFHTYRHPASKYIAWLFFIFFGYVFIHSYYLGKDAYSYVERFIEHHNYWMGFESLKRLFYSGDSKYVDIYQPLITWATAYFTGNPRWLFAVFAAVFGYFYVQNIWIILGKIDRINKNDYAVILFIILFILINPIWNINTVRMWTAAHVYLYGLLRYMVKNERIIGQFWIVASLFFHFSFLFAISLFFAYKFLPKNLIAFFIFFFATSFIRELDLSALRSSLSFLPDFFQGRVEIYTNETYSSSIRSMWKQASIHEILYARFSRYLLYLWVYLVFLQRKNWLNRNPNIKNLFMFGLFFGGFAQIASKVPSGGRFITVASLILYAVFVIFVADKSIGLRLKWYKQLSIPILIFIILFQIRIGFDFMGISTFVSNPIVALFFEDQVPLIEFIKGFI